MKKLFFTFAVLNIAALALSACAPAPAPAAETVGDNASVAENPTGVAGAEAVAPADPGDAVLWTQDYITQVPPIMMIEPYFEIFGQTAGPVPYYYEEAVKLAGHSCGAVAGAWTITKKALEALYPNGEYPVRGQIFVEAPGAEDEWFVGVFGDVIMYITGAAPKTGFNGSDFAVNDLYVRQNKMIYTEEPTNQLPPMGSGFSHALIRAQKWASNSTWPSSRPCLLRHVSKWARRWHLDRPLLKRPPTTSSIGMTERSLSSRTPTWMASLR